MSPQSSSLGLIGGDLFKSSTLRSGFRSGIYRPEDNAFIRNYAENVDNFYYTGNSFTYGTTVFSDPFSLSGIYIKPELDRIYACSGSASDSNNSVTSDNTMHLKYFSQNGKVSSITSPITTRKVAWITGSFNNTTTWNSEPTGLSFKPDGSQVILCGNLVTIYSFSTTTEGPIIFQYSLGTNWNISTTQGSGVGQTVTFLGSNYTIYDTTPDFYGPGPKIYGFGTSSTDRIYDIFIHPDGTTFYYLMGGSNVSTLYQGSISSTWDIGTDGSNLTLNTASLTLDTSIAGGFTWVGYFSGISFNSTGTKLYVISKAYGGIIYQYNLSTPWQISTASFKTFLYVGQFKSEIQGAPQGIIMLPDGESMICAGLNGSTGKLYEYSLLPY